MTTSKDAAVAKENEEFVITSIECGHLNPILNVTESDVFEGYNCGFAAAEAFFNDGVKVTFGKTKLFVCLLALMAVIY